MSEADDDSDPIEPPDIGNWLLLVLEQRKAEYEEQYGSDPTDDGARLERALDAFNRHALRLVSTGVIPAGLADGIEQFMPGDATETKIRELLLYRIVHHRLEFGVAEDVCGRLSGLSERIAFVVLLQSFMLGHGASDTAVKYLERASTLYLAGFDTETMIMSGVVLEAALEARFRDELLTTGGKPRHKSSQSFDMGQLMTHERERHPLLNDAQRECAKEVWRWRCDAVHVQPDIGPPPEHTLANLAMVLPALTRDIGGGPQDRSHG